MVEGAGVIVGKFIGIGLDGGFDIWNPGLQPHYSRSTATLLTKETELCGGFIMKMSTATNVVEGYRTVRALIMKMKVSILSVSFEVEQRLYCWRGTCSNIAQ